MRRILSGMLAVILASGLCACGAGEQKPQAAEGFVPALDTESSADIVVKGSYDNFESLEAIFDNFNEYYPKVSLSYVKLDDYNNTIGTVLDSGDAPNIYFSNSWMYGRDKYEACLRHAEDLSDPSLGLDLGCIRQNLLPWDEDGALPMVPIFSTSYGMLVNEDLFRKEGLEVPVSLTELRSVCDALLEKGYSCPMLGYLSEKPVTAFPYILIYPYYCGSIADDPDAVEAANALSPEAGEFMRPSLELLMDLIDRKYIDLEECRNLKDGYTALILRFFEGDIPMMFCSGDTVSGTRKRESQSEAFQAAPFTYRFYAVPVTEEGAYLVDTKSVSFSVNKDCEDLAMTNEFMRFLITAGELNKMAEIKRLITPTTDYSYDDIYAPLSGVPEERIVCPEKIGLMDDVSVQLRNAVTKVVAGELSIDEAVARYGSLE